MFRSLLLASALLATGTLSIVAPAPVAQAQDDTPWQLPTTPPRCSVQQAESGDVGDCLLAFYADPADTGWGQPPAPGIGDGWNWNGYTYNKSPALAGWETNFIAENAIDVAGMRTGQFQTHVSAQALFEGFLEE